ncbi:MAG: hypothetical protein ACRDTJ_17490 [Pseudonocardiaceae bacterium]
MDGAVATVSAAALSLSADTRRTAGVILLTVLAIEWGGWYLLNVARGRVQRTPLQQRFERAGHAHAGVLVILALVGLLFADAAQMPRWLELPARNGIAAAAVLVPAGFFLSVIGSGVTRPSRLLVLVHLGMLSLGLGATALAVGLLIF